MQRRLSYWYQEGDIAMRVRYADLQVYSYNANGQIVLFRDMQFEGGCDLCVQLYSWTH